MGHSFTKCTKILFFSQVNGLVWWTWHQHRRHHECGDGRLDCGEPAAGPRCRPPESTSHSGRPRLFARPHPVFRSPQPTGRLFCTIGKEDQSVCMQVLLTFSYGLFQFLFTQELSSVFLVSVLVKTLYMTIFIPIVFVIFVFLCVFCHSLSPWCVALSPGFGDNLKAISPTTVSESRPHADIGWRWKNRLFENTANWWSCCLFCNLNAGYCLHTTSSVPTTAFTAPVVLWVKLNHQHTPTVSSLWTVISVIFILVDCVRTHWKGCTSIKLPDSRGHSPD